MIKRIHMGKRNREVIGNVVGAFAVKGVSLIISVMLLPAYLRFFNNQTILGIWYTILSILNWVMLFDLGLGNGLRNKLPEAIEMRDNNLMKSYISTTYVLMGGIALVIAVIGATVIPYANWNSIFNVNSSIISNTSLIKCVEVVFAGIMLQIVLKIVTSILYAVQKAAVVNALSLISNIIILVAILVIPSRSIEENMLTMSFINVFAANVPYLLCTIILFKKSLKKCRPSISWFKRTYVKDIFSIGFSLLWLQLVFMVISSTNEIMISNFTTPDNVVEYQAYYKIFKTGAMMVSLALTPIWSAITKAQAQKDFKWIKKVYGIFLVASLGCFVIELCMVPFLQIIMDVWLGNETIMVNTVFAVIFAFSSAMMILHNVNTSIGNGLSYFKLQMIWMTVAGVICVPLAYVCVRLTKSWIGVVIGTSVAIVPYEILAPFYTLRMINKNIFS